jgi:hypothetical protein
MIGSLTEPVACRDIMVSPGMIIISQFFGYNGSYLPEDTLRPSNGYWIKVNEAGTLYLNIPLLTKASYSRINIVDMGELPPPAPSDGEYNPSTTLRVPNEFHLEQNYPNPFNPTTNIEYRIPEPEPTARYGAGMNYEFVTLKIFDILGQEVATLVNGMKKPGSYSVNFDGSKLSSGMYFYQLKAGNYSDIKKMVLMK